LAVSGAISSKHNNAATASGLIGFLQMGSAAWVATGISAEFGVSAKVLGISILVLGLIALSASITWTRRQAPEVI